MSWGIISLLNRVNDKKGHAKSKFGIHQDEFRFPLGGSSAVVGNCWIFPAESLPVERLRKSEEPVFRLVAEFLGGLNYTVEFPGVGRGLPLVSLL